MKRKAVAVALAAVFVSAPVFAGGVVADNGLENVITQSEILNDNGDGLEVIKGSSVSFADSLSNSDITISSSGSQGGMAIRAGEGGTEMTAPSFVTIHAKNISVSGSSSGAYGIQTVGTEDAATAVNLTAKENIAVTSTCTGAGGVNCLSLNVSDGLGKITLEAGRKISLSSVAPEDSTGSYAVYVSSDDTDSEYSEVLLKAPDIVVSGNGGLVAFNGRSRVTLAAENTNDIHAVGSSPNSMALKSLNWDKDSEVKGLISVVGASNKIVSDSGLGIYANAGDVEVTSLKALNTVSAARYGIYAWNGGSVSVKSAESNSVSSASDAAVFAFAKGEVRLNAEKENSLSGSHGVYAGYSGYDPAKVTLEAAKNTVTAPSVGLYSGFGSEISLTATDSNAVTADSGVGIFMFGDAKVLLKAEKDNTVSAGALGIRAGYEGFGGGSVTLEAENNTVTAASGTALLAGFGTAVSIVSKERLTLSGEEASVLAASGASVKLSAKTAEISGASALLAEEGGAIELNAGTLNLSGEDGAALSYGAGSEVKITAAGGSVSGDFVAGDGGTAELSGSALKADSNLYIAAASANDADTEATQTGAVVSADLRDGSVLTGVIDDGSEGAGKAGSTKLSLSGGSVWNAAGDSAVTELSGDGGAFDLSSGAYKRVTAGTFSGTGNKITLRINMAEEKVSDDAEERKADQLKILKSSGNSENQVGVVLEKDTEDASKLHSANWLVKADSVDGALKMSGSAGKTIAADGSEKSWTLKFVKDPSSLDSMSSDELDALGDTASGEGGEWYLVRSSETNEEVQTVQDFSSAFGEYYAWFADLSDLRQRLGEVRSGAKQGGWVKVSYAKYRADSIGSGRFRTRDYSIHAGFDHIASENADGQWLLGGSFKSGHSDMDTNHGSAADVNHYSGKFYGTYIGREGGYADFVGSVGFYDKKFYGVSNTGLNRVRGDYNTWGAGVSAEAGRKITFGSRTREDGSLSSWFAEPQAQLSYFWVRGKDFRTSTGMSVRQENSDFLTGRLGFVFGGKLSASAANPDRRYVQAAVRGGVMYEFLGDDIIRVNGERHEGKIDGTALYYGLDFDWNFADNHRLYLQVDRVHSSGYTKEIEARIGYRYQF